MTRVALGVLFALLCAVLYLCALGVVATRSASVEEHEKQAIVAIGGAALVFVLVLWERLA